MLLYLVLPVLSTRMLTSIMDYQTDYPIFYQIGAAMR